MKAMTPRMPQALSSFARDRRGVSAVEFAVLAPFMIGLYIGCVEISSAIAIQRKVSLISTTVANLTSQVTGTITGSELTDLLNASTAIIAPYSNTNVGATVSCLSIDANKNVKVAWSQGSSARGVGSTVVVPDKLQVASTQLLFAEATYTYTPTIAVNITGTINLQDHMYMRPRLSANPPTLDNGNGNILNCN